MQANYSDSVFINCPFDSQYNPIFRAIVFTVYRCGFLPVCALDEDNGLDNRLRKIEKQIQSCQYGIHDLSRAEQNSAAFPRFNMPFELGIFWGAKKFGNQRQRGKNALIFDSDKYRYQQFISDLNGVDIKAHHNDPAIVVRTVRDWLKTSSKRTTIPGHNIIIREFRDFTQNLPGICSNLGIDTEDILFNDYCLIVEESLRKKLE